MTSGRARRARRAVAVGLLVALTATCGAQLPDQTRPGWTSPGLIGGGGWPFAHEPLDATDGHGARYLPDSSVVRLASGRLRLIPLGAERAVTVDQGDPRVAAAVAGDQAWLASGRVPGAGTGYRDMAARALLDLRLLTRPNGATTASWYDAWSYVWPRDAAFAVAAFTESGHPTEARRVLRFLARAQTSDGRWAARYRPDGSAVIDGRRPQLDSLGWVLWAGWLFQLRAPEAAAELPELWPMMRRAADRLASSLDAEGLPPPSPDYFERNPGREQDPRRPTLGVIGPVLAGLRAAADLAARTGHVAEAGRWRTAGHRLADAVSRTFAPYGYPRSPIPGGLMDTSVTFLGPPFGPADPTVAVAVANAAERLRLPNGGVLPGERWSGNREVAWTPEMALFTLSAAASGRYAEATTRLDWLARHRTSLGVLPEKVDKRGRPAAVAPLGWTASLVLLSLDALDNPLPSPPA